MGLATNDVVQVTFFGTLFSQRIMTVLNYVVTQPAVGTSIAQDLDDIVTTFGNPATATLPLNKLLACQGPEVVQDYVRAQQIYTARSVYDQLAIASPGTHADSTKTANVAASVTKKSLLAGRHGIGRVQVAGVPDSQLVAGKLNGAYLTLLQTFGDTLIGEKTMAGGALKLKCVITRASGAVASAVSQTVPQDTVRTMHRRTVGLGV